MSNDHLNHHRRAGRSPGRVATIAGAHKAEAFASPNVTVFRCVNCSAGHLSQPEPEWPIPVHEIALPCSGRLQPEHLLKAFEAGADAVCVITCGRNDCHYLEGSLRSERRVEYVRELLDEIGLGRQRLLLFHLAAPAQEITPFGHAPNGSSPGMPPSREEVASRPLEICEMVMAELGALQPNPLRQGKAAAQRHDGSQRDGANGSRD